MVMVAESRCFLIRLLSPISHIDRAFPRFFASCPEMDCRKWGAVANSRTNFAYKHLNDQDEGWPGTLEVAGGVNEILSLISEKYYV